jgi:hypothetical protein
MKITIEQQEKGAELIKTLTQKAWESSAFKEQLVKNPVATIEQIVGKELTTLNDKRIVVEDQTDESVIYFNIPAKMNLDELELTEEQLEMVAGGLTPVAIGFGVAIGVCWLVSQI